MSDFTEQRDAATGEAGSTDSVAGLARERLAAWIQFPRRLLFLLLAGAAATLLITVLPMLFPGVSLLGHDRPPVRYGFVWWWEITSPITGRPVIGEVAPYLPSSLVLLGSATAAALALASVMVLLAGLFHRLEDRIGPLGSLLKGLGRLVAFPPAALPPLALAILLLFLFAVRLRWLPVGGAVGPEGVADLGDRVRRLILPALALAVFPAVNVAQAVARAVTLPRAQGGGRLWLAAGLFGGLAALFGQTGGLLGACILVEIIFSRPGLGRLAFSALASLNLAVFFGAAGLLVAVVLVGRVLAEAFRWAERLLASPLLSPPPPATRWRRAARVIWGLFALFFLLAPVTVAALGVWIGPDAGLVQDVQAAGAPPSADHPWGTDALGRDVRARTLYGGLITLEVAGLAALVAWLPAALGGALIGFLSSRRAWWAESLADLLLLPADVLTLIPAVMGTLLAWLLVRPGPDTAWYRLGLVVAVLLLPRLVRLYAVLWNASPARGRWLAVGLAGPGVLLLGGLFSALVLVAAADFLGVGVSPPTPTLGRVISDGLIGLLSGSTGALPSVLLLGVCAFAFYLATDALVGFFATKEAMSRLSE